MSEEVQRVKKMTVEFVCELLLFLEYWWEDEFADVPVRVLPHRRVSALRHSGRGEVSVHLSAFIFYNFM